MDTYQKTQTLIKYICRVRKASSSYFYFTLEANEGIAFYSTLNQSIDDDHRDILIHGPIELRPQMQQILNSIAQVIDVEIILADTIYDDKNSKLQL